MLYRHNQRNLFESEKIEQGRGLRAALGRGAALLALTAAALIARPGAVAPAPSLAVISSDSSQQQVHRADWLSDLIEAIRAATGGGGSGGGSGGGGG